MGVWPATVSEIMSKHIKPDWELLKIPSLTATKSFVAAAKYQSFTRAAEALCVTQAAVSRQIRELEASLGVELFNRTGRSVELTDAGQAFYDAAYLSFINVSQAAKRLKLGHMKSREVNVCCSPAFSALWLSRHLPDFLAQHPEIPINIITANNFRKMGLNLDPDVFINKINIPHKGYSSTPLFYDIIYPVCSPNYLQQHPEINDLESLSASRLLNLTPYGRSQLAEHVDWSVWFSLQGISDREQIAAPSMSCNDYATLIDLVLDHQGVTLGWHHLVAPLVERGELVRPVENSLVLKETQHYMSVAEQENQNSAVMHFTQWLLDRADSFFQSSFTQQHS